MPTLTDRELEEALHHVRRFIEGETVRTIYKLPENGRFDPLRQDLTKLLSSYEERGRALEPFAEAWKLAAEQCPRNTLGAVKAVANYHTEASHYQQAARSLSPSGGGE